jgi:hypothetical protein
MKMFDIHQIYLALNTPQNLYAIIGFVVFIAFMIWLSPKTGTGPG